MTPEQWAEIPVKDMLQRSWEAMSPKQRYAVGHAKPGRATDDIWMGLGKTFIGLTVGLIHKPRVWLILGSKGSMNVWRQEIIKWYPELTSIKDHYKMVRGQKAEREQIWLQAKRGQGLFYSTTFGSLIRDIAFLEANNITFEVITIDEPQKGGLRNRKTAGFKAIKVLEKTCECLWLGSGSLTTKGTPQLWTYLNLMNKKVFSSYWQFMTKFMLAVSGPFGKEFIRPQNSELLAKVSAPYIYKVDKEEANKELPPMRRIKLPTELTPKLASMYNTMALELFMEFEGIDAEDKFLSVANPLSAFTKLRQLITCPAIVDPALGPGVAIEAVCDKIQEYDGPGWQHQAIYTPYVGAIQPYKQYIIDNLGIPENKILILQGGVEPEDVQRVEHRYRTESDTIALLSLMYSESFNLETGQNGYFAHFDWDQTKNEQAEARIRRRTSDLAHTISYYYVDIPGSITGDMFTVLNEKVATEKWTYKHFDIVRKALQRKVEGSD